MFPSIRRIKRIKPKLLHNQRPSSGCCRRCCRRTRSGAPGGKRASDAKVSKRPQKPIDNGESDGGIDGVARSNMAISAVVRNTLIMLADVDNEGDPGSEEQSPVGELEEVKEMMMVAGTIGHSKRQNPKGGNYAPCTLNVSYILSLRWMG